MGKENYFYGMAIRPASFNTHPRDGLKSIMSGYGAYWNVLKYDRKLTDEEISHYGLTELRKEEEIK